MIDFSTGALTPLSMLNATANSAYISSVISQHVPSHLFLDSTGSLKINTDWLKEQTRSGQNYHIVEGKDNILEKVIENQENALVDKLELIKTVFSMTEFEIAESIGISRKTLFNWKQRKSAPNKIKAQNIFDLYLLAKNWQNFGFKTDSFELELPILGGKSVKDLLKDGKLDSEKILFAGNRLNHKNLDEIELF